jgi:Excalibur calcium-binding domain
VIATRMQRTAATLAGVLVLATGCYGPGGGVDYVEDASYAAWERDMEATKAAEYYEQDRAMELIGEAEERRQQRASVGRDRDCQNFRSHREAQSFYEASGGPYSDPHVLDEDGDGVACEALR